MTPPSRGLPSPAIITAGRFRSSCRSASGAPSWFIWFLIAGVWALHHNRLYGDPALQTINTFLFAAFLAKTICFFFIFGGFSGDMVNFAGYSGIEHLPERGHLPSGPAARRRNGRTAGALPARPRLQPAFQR